MTCAVILVAVLLAGHVPAVAAEDEVYASLNANLYRSIAMRCREFEVVLGPDESLSFGQYLVDFYGEPPASGLALVGNIMHSSATLLDFEVHSAPGPWEVRAGCIPRLQRLTLRREPNAVDRHFHCRGLALSGEEDNEVSLSIDTSKAFNWIRFSGYLDWAQYIIGRVQQVGAFRSASDLPLVVDMGGGSGWMSALLKSHLGNNCDVLCTDVAEEALEQAHETADENDLDFQVELGDMFEPLKRRGQAADFVFFYPPQEQGEEGEWRGSPDVSLLSPEGDLTHFHERFCREAELAPGGVAWLGVNWALLPETIRLCCNEGWTVQLPEALKDDTTCPSALLELSRPEGAPGDVEACVEEAMVNVRSAAEFQSRAVGASSDEERAAQYRAAAERGFAAGEVRLGVAYMDGSGVRGDAALAEEYLTSAAEKGREDAMSALGRLLASQDRTSDAARWFREAAEHGHPRSQTSLGFLLLSNNEVEQAMGWLARAANLGDVRAITTLGDSFAQGFGGVEQDDREAAAWYRQAADAGDVVAMTNLGLFCTAGRGLDEPNIEDAMQWFRKAADMGGVSAMYNLGVFYDTGELVEEDEAAAAEWYRRAAKGGSPQAQTRLGFMYMVGRGVREDQNEAHSWLSKAAEAGDEEAIEFFNEMERWDEEGAADEAPDAAPPAATARQALRAPRTPRRPALGLRLAGQRR